MYAKLCIVLLLAVGLSQAEIKYLPDGGLLQFMMQSRDLSLGNPECFVYYVPVLNDIVNQYQKDYELCLENAEAARQGIDDKTADNRTEIDNSASNACSALQECSAEKSALTYFECYVNAGSENAKSMYTISANSAELLAQVQEDYRLIQVNEFACTNKSERAYVENTAAAYADLDDCLKGIKPVPTASPDSTTGAPTAAPTDSSSTALPEESSSSAAPEPTSNPTTEPESSSSALPEESSSSAAPEPTSNPTTEPESSSSALPEESSSSAAPEPTSNPTTEPESSSSALPEESSSSAAPEPTSNPTTEVESSSSALPEESTSSAAPEREKMPEEDLRVASNADIKSIIDNLKNWMKRHAKPSQLQSSLDQYLLKSRNFDVDALSADVTSQCFTLYLPMLNEVAATFSTSYQACISTANAETTNLTAEATKQQAVYQQDVSTLCSAFTACDSDNDTATFFNCYASAAEGDVSVIYDIATNAASSANSLSASLKAIQDTEYQCTNTTESNYVRDTAATYDLLDECLKNGVPTAAPTSTNAAPLSSTTTTTLDVDSTSTVAKAVAVTTAAAPVVVASTIAAST
ncbi:protein TsetseEP [Drosophila tropicalis]|uniref:protein TsetseEP n=1 Tax=Drosophila tropicalis TaxID=46794 RepID=UPI0035ABE76E